MVPASTFEVRYSVPLVRHSKQLCLGHLDDRQHLAAFRDERFINGPHDSEGAPKPNPLEPVEPAFDHEPIAQLRRAAVIDFGPDDHRILLVLGHLREAEPELFGEKSPRDFDEAQVGDVMNDGGAVRIEEHHLHVGADARRAFVQHAKPSFRKRLLKQRNLSRAEWCLRRCAVPSAAPEGRASARPIARVDLPFRGGLLREFAQCRKRTCGSMSLRRGASMACQFSECAARPRSSGVSHLSSSELTAAATSGTVTAFMQRKSIGHSRRKQGLHST